MRTDLLQALQVLAQLAIHAVCQYLRVLAIHNVTLAIKEPSRNFVLSRVLNNGDNAFEFFGRDFASSENGNPLLATLVRDMRDLDRRAVGRSIPLVQIHIGLFAHQIGVTASDTLDLGEGVHDLLLAIDVGVEKTKDELEVRLLSRDECCLRCERVTLEV